MESEKKGKEFKKNDVIVYPLQGVGVIKSIEERVFKGENTKYYNIYIETIDMTVMIPAEKCEDLKIRKIITKKKAETLLETIETAEQYVFSSDWKVRYQNSMEQIRDGSLLDVLKVLRALYLRSKTKDLPIMERKLYDSSLRALAVEFSLALRLTEQETKELLIKKFELPLK